MKRSPTLQRRILILGVCVIAGGFVGAIGEYLFDSSAGFLAVPAFIIVAWLFVANPTECLPREERSSRKGSASQ
jgi:uncharacterized membrane protein YfcA